MANTLDQIFVLLKHWIVALFPVALQPLIGILLSVVAIIATFPALFALTTVIERKGLGRMQNRIGPNRTGPYGILQPIADGIKSLTKEDIIPVSADAAVHFIAPLVLVVVVFMGFAVLPMGRNMQFVEMDAGLLFYFAIGASAELSIFMAGWSSRNKYSLLGAMRAVAQMISYEVPLLMSTVAIVMITGSLSLSKVVEAQNQYTWGLPHWYIFTPWGFAAFVMYCIAATAETNRSPFDLPEGESELVAGYFTEYSGFKFALFFLGEYLAMFSISGLGTTLFLGGWSAPLAILNFVPSWIWFFSKVMLSIVVLIWIRGTLPRLRQDQLMNFAWKFVLPMTLLNLIVAGLWRFMGEGILRWIVCSAILLGVYVIVGRLQMHRKKFGPRSYRYAE
ncbi:NADH-quinone oxidoreductase subunit NuoH [Occallatibacter riparius]|uniref:NADH-quinone oxidoreductase subunit H n=1 Tax=Occallatibacter riparius TaxID=1002689 RepID=A0A9J7BR40_9BACT|nr:NADH-quinone oxidoreductase subunit NuoH [Occallatibacter riparius]UWZ83398.1 NADH-quinone oxidoreductase subunit NuoH [Occallatibacter riparius]